MAWPAAAPRPSVPAPRHSRLALARARHRSLLRRRTDRWRSAAARCKLLAGIGAAVLCAGLGMSVYQQASAHALDQARQLRPVQAEIIGQPYATGVGGVEMAKVSWTGADGKAHQGAVSVSSSGGVGDRTRVWLDAAGDIATPPASSQSIIGTAVLTGMLALTGAEALILCAGALVRSRLDRWDERVWETEWEIYEPLWSRRH